MKVLVAVKRVVDHTVKIRTKPDGSGVDTQYAKMSMNPFDEIAVEEAIRLKEKGIAKEIVILTIGDTAAVDILRHGLALGADKAVHIVSAVTPEPLDIAHILKTYVDQEKPELVILGKQAIDDDCNQVGQMLAGLLNWPQGTFASEATVADGCIQVAREVDGGIEKLSLPLPAVVTTDLRLNQPRYATLPNVMKAKQKPLDTIDLAAFGYTLRNKQTVTSVTEPTQRKSGVRVASVAELVSQLKNAKAI